MGEQVVGVAEGGMVLCLFDRCQMGIIEGGRAGEVGGGRYVRRIRRGRG